MQNPAERRRRPRPVSSSRCLPAFCHCPLIADKTFSWHGRQGKEDEISPRAGVAAAAAGQCECANVTGLCAFFLSFSLFGMQCNPTATESPTNSAADAIAAAARGLFPPKAAVASLSSSSCEQRSTSLDPRKLPCSPAASFSKASGCSRTSSTLSTQDSMRCAPEEPAAAAAAPSANRRFVWLLGTGSTS